MPCETRVSGIRLVDRDTLNRAAKALGMSITEEGYAKNLLIQREGYNLGYVTTDGSTYAYDRRAVDMLQQQYSKILVSDQLAQCGFVPVEETTNAQGVVELTLRTW